jgi:hypothetical protein
MHSAEQSYELSKDKFCRGGAVQARLMGNWQLIS